MPALQICGRIAQYANVWRACLAHNGLEEEGWPREQMLLVVGPADGLTDGSWQTLQSGSPMESWDSKMGLAMESSLQREYLRGEHEPSHLKVN